MTIRQWCVYETSGGELALVLQSDLLEAAATRIVAPVVPSALAGDTIPRLAPVVAIGDETLHAMIPLLGTVPVASLRTLAFDASDRADAVVRALDMLLSGV